MTEEKGPVPPARALEAVVALVRSKWAIRILAALAGGPLRHGDLRDEIHEHHCLPGEPPISYKVFTETLRTLIDNGIIENNKQSNGFSVQSWYALTSHGRGFIAASWPLVRWYQSYAVDDGTRPDAG